MSIGSSPIGSEPIGGYLSAEEEELFLVLAANAGLGSPVAFTVAVPEVLSATASLGVVTYGLAVNPLSVAAIAALGVPEVAIVVFPAVVTATSALGEPTWAAVAAPYPILSWARLDPILALGYAAAVDATVVVFNANTLAVTEYSIDALDVVEHEGELYFVLADGLSKLGSGTLPTAVIETGMLTLGADEKKYLPDFKTTLSGDSTTQVWVTIELDGRELELGPYQLYGRSGAAQFVRRMKLAGGVKADSVSFRFEGSAGTAWGLSGLIVQAELL